MNVFAENQNYSKLEDILEREQKIKFHLLLENAFLYLAQQKVERISFSKLYSTKVFTNLPNCGLGEEYKPLPSGPAGLEDMEVTFWSRTFSIQDRSL